MLRELSVRNLALIEDLRVELDRGYCVWTGETGAGKSLLLNALGLVLGGKGSAELVRSGKPEAIASAVFEVNDPALRAEIESILGGSFENDEIIIHRRIGSSGRSGAHVNGLPVPLATLRTLGERLIDFHGQDEGRALADPDQQRRLLDAYGRLDDALASYRACREAHGRLRTLRRELLQNVENRERMRMLLELERDELAGLDPKPDEFQSLQREAQKLANAEAIREAAAKGYALLYEADESVQSLLERVGKQLSGLSIDLPEFANAKCELDRLAEETREIAYTLRDLNRNSKSDARQLDKIESRLAHYRKLASRFRQPVDALAARLAEINSRLESIETDDEQLKALDAPIASAWSKLKSESEVLSRKRLETSRGFAKQVLRKLRPLGMTEATLDVVITTENLGDDPNAAPPSEDGADRIEIVFSANPGEPLKPLRKVASGGELSRVTLALKTVLAEVDKVPTLVFDEIDTGVGGRLGSVLGKTLATLGKHHQVICVTHLPQMASHATKQWRIEKRVDRGRTRTTIEPLGESERIEELAAMLRGDSVAEGTRQEALAMLLEAQSSR